MDKKFQDFADHIKSAKQIVVVQADNPDADSLGSAIALESILHSMDKNVSLYCGVDIPDYLKYLTAWSRVVPELPNNYDCLIIVDASSGSLLEKLYVDKNFTSNKTTLVLDHHASVQDQIKAQVIINEPELSSTGELIYKLFRNLDIEIPIEAAESILAAIMGDTQGLSNSLASPDTYRVVANIIEAGVDRSALEEARRTYSKMTEDIFRYKAKLIERTELFINNSLAIVRVPYDEIVLYSPKYNPVALIQFDMLQIEGVRVAIVFKTYNDAKITAAIRANSGTPIAGKIATEFGGGGHDYASGFKITNKRNFDDLKSECINYIENQINKG